MPESNASPSGALNVYLGADLKARWESHCVRLGLKPGAAIRMAIEGQLSRSAPAPESDAGPARPKAATKQGRPDEGGRVRRELRLTPSEDQVVQRAAAAEDCSPQFWMVAAIRGALTHDAQFTMEPARAVWESNNQLRAIGRNLNQIAKALNQSGSAAFTQQDIETLRDQIDQHTKTVAQLTNACIQRWILE